MNIELWGIFGLGCLLGFLLFCFLDRYVALAFLVGSISSGSAAEVKFVNLTGSNFVSTLGTNCVVIPPGIFTATLNHSDWTNIHSALNGGIESTTNDCTVYCHPGATNATVTVDVMPAAEFERQYGVLAAGFGFTFGFGLLALGAKWVRRIVVAGGSNE